MKETVRATRVTEGNAQWLAFAAKFPGADKEPFSVLRYRQESPLAPGGELITLRGTENPLRKLERLECLNKFRNPATGRVHYGATELGVECAREFGWYLPNPRGIQKLSLERLTHYAAIAHVAAQFVSPVGFFEESLGIAPVRLEDVLSENELRGAFEPIRSEMIAAKNEGRASDYGRYREEVMRNTLASVKDKKMIWSDLLTAHPELFTIGQPKREGSKAKQVHQPDFAVKIGESGRGATAQNLLVEVEISKKSWEAYDAILATYAAELAKPLVYGRVVYFIQSRAIANLLQKVDAAGGYGLIESGKLVILPILHRDGTPLEKKNRVVVGGN